MNQKHRSHLGRDAQKMYLIRGIVSNLYTTDGTLNLLEAMQRQTAATGVGAAVGGMAGSAANAAMVSMYEGEAVKHFGCYVGEQMLIGTFPEVSFSNGDEVSVVVSELDSNVTFAHAVVRLADSRLWMPLSVEKGRVALALFLAKMMASFSLIASLFMVPMLYSYEIFGGFLVTVAAFIAGMAGVSLLLGIPTYLSSPESAYAERIMKVLGFKNPKMVNLSPFSERTLRIKSGERLGSLQVYDLRAALAAHN